ncbi:MAG: polysaccharide deacetylase family protein [Okeania sp. SIO1H6]|nr:polysaccharide deacetylase family protein [Okeania sp. SIO1H6]
MLVSEDKISVNVDIDGIRFYYGIHGLTQGTSPEPDPVWTFGVPRFLNLFTDLGLSATFFIVASDLVSISDGGAVRDVTEVKRRRELVCRMIAQGHEVASHSFGHDYALSRQRIDEIKGDLQKAVDILSEVTDMPVKGFRAPGYNLSPPLIDAISESGANYSSSRLPSPPYFLAKWLVMLKGVLSGQPSRSIVGEMMAPFFPRHPYRHQEGLLELPMSVIPLLRLPAIGTFFALYGDYGLEWLLPHLKKENWLNLEFHGIDLVDASDPKMEQKLVHHQLDLLTPVVQKRNLFSSWLSRLAKGRVNQTLTEVANSIDEGYTR